MCRNHIREWKVDRDRGLEDRSLEYAHLCVKNPKHGDEEVREGPVLIIGEHLTIGFLRWAGAVVWVCCWTGGSRHPMNNQHIGVRSAATARLWMFIFSYYCSIKQIKGVLGKRVTLGLVLGVGKNAAERVFLTPAVV